MANLGHDIKIDVTNSKNTKCCLIALTIIIFLTFNVIGIVFCINGRAPIGAVFFALTVILPFIIFMIYGVILRNKYKINPKLKVNEDWVIQGTLCPKCRIGKINYSILLNGQENICGNTNNQFFVCLNCNTVYPENYLTIYFGMNPPWVRRNS